jgi:NADPH-dependent 2,4-dienoyl-CoA reductase/sulfur reductase-like enzyme
MSLPRGVLVIGGGLGGAKVIEQLRARGFAGSITLVSDEARLPYDRPPLSKQVLDGAWDLDRTALLSQQRMGELDVRAHLGNGVVAFQHGKATLADGLTISADYTVIACGLAPRRLPGQPRSVRVLRTLDDAIGLRTALDSAGSLLVVGAGLIGAEVASSARRRGLAVTMIEVEPVPMRRLLGPAVGALATRLAVDHGVVLRTGVAARGFGTDPSGHIVVHSDEEDFHGDVVVAGVGGVPAVDWLAHESAYARAGVRCDDTGRVLGLDGVRAVGDVAAWEMPGAGFRRTEHWFSAVEQAAIVAAAITDTPPPLRKVPYFWSDQFGIKIQVFGWPEETCDVVQLHGASQDKDPSQDNGPNQGNGAGEGSSAIPGTVVGYLRDSRLAGVAGFGAQRLTSRYLPLVAEGASRSDALRLASSLS